MNIEILNSAKNVSRAIKWHGLKWFSEQDFVCYFIDEENIQILKSRLSKRGKVDYSEFLKILSLYDKNLQMKYQVKKLSEISKKYNVTIITATEAKDPFSRIPSINIKYGPDVIFIDYLDAIKLM